MRFLFGQLKFCVNQQCSQQKNICEVSFSIASGYHSSVILCVHCVKRVQLLTPPRFCGITVFVVLFL